MIITRVWASAAVVAFVGVNWCAAQSAPPTTSAATSPATSPAASTRPAGLDALVQQLGSSEWKVRDAAQTLIVQMGAAAIKPVEELASLSDDPEVKQRAREILRQIAVADFTKPSLVTLHFKNASAREVYESLYAQANAKPTTWPPNLFQEPAGRDPKPLVTVDLDKVPFWTAIAELQDQTGLTVDDIGNEMKLTDAQHRGGGRGRVCVTGPFMVVADDSFGGGMIHELKVFVEPRIHVLSHAREPEIAEATDVNGDAVRKPRQAMHMGRQFDEFGGNAFNVRLDSPLMRVGRLKGSVRAVVLTREQTVEITDVAKANNVEKKAGGRRFMLNAMNPEPGDWFITVIAYNSNPPIPGLERMRTTLVDANGVALRLGGHGSSSNGRRVDFNMEFSQGPNCGPPAKLSMVVPIETQEIQIPFEFNRDRGGGAGGGAGGAGRGGGANNRPAQPRDDVLQ